MLKNLPPIHERVNEDTKRRAERFMKELNKMRTDQRFEHRSPRGLLQMSPQPHHRGNSSLSNIGSLAKFHMIQKGKDKVKWNFASNSMSEAISRGDSISIHRSNSYITGKKLI